MRVDCVTGSICSTTITSLGDASLSTKTKFSNAQQFTKPNFPEFPPLELSPGFPRVNRLNNKSKLMSRRWLESFSQPREKYFSFLKKSRKNLMFSHIGILTCFRPPPGPENAKKVARRLRIAACACKPVGAAERKITRRNCRKKAKCIISNCNTHDSLHLFSFDYAQQV